MKFHEKNWILRACESAIAVAGRGGSIESGKAAMD
jgi:hypothetical protein